MWLTLPLLGVSWGRIGLRVLNLTVPSRRIVQSHLSRGGGDSSLLGPLLIVERGGVAEGERASSKRTSLISSPPSNVVMGFPVESNKDKNMNEGAAF